MEKLKQKLGPEGLYIPTEIMERCGIEEGKSIALELHRHWIKILLEEIADKEIENIALDFLLENVGDAVGVSNPVSKDGKWIVPVRLSYAKKEIGELVFSKAGTLIPEESTSLEQILKKVNED